MHVELNRDAIAEIVKGAIVQQLGDPEALVKAAIEELLAEGKKEPGAWGQRGRSVVQDAFRDGVRIAAERSIERVLSERPELQAAVDAAVESLLAHFLEKHKDVVADAFAEVFTKKMRGW